MVIGVPVKDPERLNNRRGYLPSSVQHRERDKVRAVGEVGPDRARGLHGEPRLADPARPGESQEPHRPGPQPLDDRGDVMLTPDRAVGRHGQPADARRHRLRLRLERRRLDGRRELGGVLEHVLVQLAQRLSRLDAELPDEPCARRLKDVQRLRLSSTAVEHQHLQLHQALLERMRKHQCLQLARKLAMAAQLQVQLDPLDDRGQPLLLQPRGLRGEQAVRAHAGERLPAPDTQRRLKPLPSHLKPAVRVRPTRPVERLLPAVDVTLAGSHLQPVAARVTDQPATLGARRGQRLVQPGDMHLQAVARPRGRFLAPQLIDQPITADDAAGHQRQDREQRPRPLTPQRHHPAIHPRLDRTEQLDPKPVGAVGHPGRHRVSYVKDASTLRRWMAAGWGTVGGRLAGPTRVSAMHSHNMALLGVAVTGALAGLTPTGASARPIEATAAPTIAQVAGAPTPKPAQDLRSPDARDAAEGRGMDKTPRIVVVAVPPKPQPASAHGIAWADAGIGAGSSLALSLIAFGGALFIVHRRRAAHATAPVAGL